MNDRKSPQNRHHQNEIYGLQLQWSHTGQLDFCNLLADVAPPHFYKDGTKWLKLNTKRRFALLCTRFMKNIMYKLNTGYLINLDCGSLK